MYEGYYIPAEHESVHHEPDGRGIEYFKNGTVYREGQFQHGGLFDGKVYYPSGSLKFEGRFNCRAIDCYYYGPTYPIYGRYYSPNGELIYQGIFKIKKLGNCGYPKVITPEGFGSA